MARQAKGGGSRGPLPQPAHLKLAPGSLPSDEPAEPLSVADLVPTGRPDVPSGMTVGELKVWTQLVDALERAGLIAECDGLTVELAVRHYCAAQAAHKTLKRSGSSVHDDKNKREAKAPASAVFLQHSAAFREYAKLLGLSYAARARIAPEEGAGGGRSSGNPFEPTGT